MITFEHVLGVLGILLTTGFGIWGLVIVLRRRYPGEITLVVGDCIGLFDAIVKNFPDLAILYHNKPVSHGLVLFKGTFLNSGQKDITADMVEGRLHIALPDGYKWLSAIIVQSSENVSAAVTKRGDALEFATGLFRRGEYLRFEALAEIPVSLEADKRQSISSKLIDGLKPAHRIADTTKVRTIRLLSSPIEKRRFRTRIGLAISAVLAGLIITGITFVHGVPQDIHFLIPDDRGNATEVSVKPNADGSVRITSNDESIDTIVSADQFFLRADIKTKIVPDPAAKYIFLFMVTAYVLLPITYLTLKLNGQRKLTRLRCQIGLGKHTQESFQSATE
jgi:hypothetical protein